MSPVKATPSLSCAAPAVKGDPRVLWPQHWRGSFALQEMEQADVGGNLRCKMQDLLSLRGVVREGGGVNAGCKCYYILGLARPTGQLRACQ